MKSFKGPNTKKRKKPSFNEDDNEEEDEGKSYKRIAGVDNASIVTNMITDIVSNNTNDSSVVYDDSGSSELYDNLSNITNIIILLK